MRVQVEVTVNVEVEVDVDVDTEGNKDVEVNVGVELESATKIKINEIINIIQVPAKNTKITDNDLVDLLQYYDLINELETVNG